MSTEKMLAKAESMDVDIQRGVARLFDCVPTASGDANSFYEGLLSGDLDAMVGVNAEGTLPSAEDVIGKTLSVKSVTKAISTESDSLFSYFIIVDSTDTETGERVLWSTGSADPTIKLLRIAQANRFPAEVILRKASKATKADRYPINLTILKLS